MPTNGLPLGWPEDFAPPIRQGTVRGIRWAVAPHHMGIAINGYAQIPAEGHPWSTCEDYDDLDVTVHGGLTFGPHRRIDLAADTARTLAELEQFGGGETAVAFAREAAEVASKIPPRKAVALAETGGWVGFDTVHSCDVWLPDELEAAGIELDEKTLGYMMATRYPSQWDRTWTLETVCEEARSLALQIAMAGGGCTAGPYLPAVLEVTEPGDETAD